LLEDLRISLEASPCDTVEYLLPERSFTSGVGILQRVIQCIGVAVEALRIYQILLHHLVVIAYAEPPIALELLAESLIAYELEDGVL
jgi:hypothetical protein